MSAFPYIDESGSLELPIFPLTGSLLLPGGILPLHIFESRYRHMVDDVLEQAPEQRLIGMVQPTEADPSDQRGEAEEPDPDVYEVGCAGYLEQHQILPQDRYLIVLRGVCRFRVRRELESAHGYRRCLVDFGEFTEHDRDLDLDVARDAILAALGSFVDQRAITVDAERLADVPGVPLLHGLAMALPFSPLEKQALLEAADVAERQQLLLELLNMGWSESPSSTVH